MRILIDMNLSPQWADWFSNVGIEAVHWSDLGTAKARKITKSWLVGAESRVYCIHP
jgi:predicted nuclease of predicted toxin-antitoxin system